MHKIVSILFLASLFSGCSVFRPTVNRDFGTISYSVDNDIIKVLENHNITSRNFFIQKAQVEVISTGINENFLASVKFLTPDTFLISLRSKTGIEAARIFLTGDTVLMNDRINRQMIYGKPEKVGMKYGITAEVLPLVFGDFISDIQGLKDKPGCEKGLAVVDSYKQGSKIRYIADCKEGKIISASRESSTNQGAMIFKFSKFVKIGSVSYPSDIIITYREMVINIKIDRFETPWDGSIDFVPGKNYELIELL